MRIRMILAALLALGLLVRIPLSADRAATPRYYKGNTHTHTLWSDGDAAPELVTAWYRDGGWEFLVLSDHNVLSRGERWFPISGEGKGRLTGAHIVALEEQFGADMLELRKKGAGEEMRLRTLAELREEFEVPDEFLMIEGEEITDSFGESQVHVNGLNLGELIEPRKGESTLDTIERNLGAVATQGRRLHRPTVAHLNHPNFRWSLGVDELAPLPGTVFFEVYNGHPGVHNRGDDERPSTERLWDLALTRRLGELGLPLLYGVATDDAHNYHVWGLGKVNPGRGWVMVRAAKLEADALMQAMLNGDFYSSSGVQLTDVTTTADEYRVDIDTRPAVSYTTRFIGTRRTGEGHGPAGELLLETTADPAVYRAKGDELYVRAQIVSSREHPNPAEPGEVEVAWTQPWIPGD